MTKFEKLKEAYLLLAKAYDETLDSEYNERLTSYKNSDVINSLKLFKESVGKDFK